MMIIIYNFFCIVMFKKYVLHLDLQKLHYVLLIFIHIWYRLYFTCIIFFIFLEQSYCRASWKYILTLNNIQTFQDINMKSLVWLTCLNMSLFRLLSWSLTRLIVLLYMLPSWTLVTSAKSKVASRCWIWWRCPLGGDPWNRWSR